MFTTTSLIAIATDLIAIAILAIPLYYRRHRRRDLMFAFLTLNVGVMVVAAAEVVVGLAIIVAIYRSRRSASIDEPNLLKY